MRPTRATGLGWLRRAAFAVLGFVLVLAIWELYKSFGPADGVSVGGVRLLPRTTDAAMPSLGRIWDAFGAPEVGGSVLSLDAPPTVFDSVFSAAWHSLAWAGAGFVLGVAVGLLLALLMDAVGLFEKALLPYVVLSQTVPLIALAPLVTNWGDGSSFGPIPWRTWMSASLIAAYLAFFPVAVGMVRGLKSPAAVHREYFRAANAGWWPTLVRLKLPASVSYLVPALRLAAAGAVVGQVVAEISIGLEGGIGRLIISYSTGATGDPSRVYTAVIGAAVLGLVAAAIVSLFDLGLRRFKTESS
ncbi:ABC transporter permease [Jatrophihabitans fulvus]